MKKSVFFVLMFILNLIHISTCAQESMIYGGVVGLTREVIPFAVIINLNNNKGVLCDSMGRFTIKGNLGDTLLASRLGYESSRYINFSSNKSVEIILMENTVTLNQLSVQGVTNYRRVGLQPRTKVRKNLYFMPTSSFVHAVCFNDDKLIGNDLKTINVKMGYKGKETEIPVRINLYKKLNNGFPGAKLGHEEIILNVSKYKWYTIKSKLESSIPEEGICVGIEPLIPVSKLNTFDKKNTPVLGVYSTNQHKSFSLTNYSKWYAFPSGDLTCPAVYLITGY